ncbi:hypothetical protein NFI96_000077 [Xyrichtys novacula]|uniref:Secreted protein n=1 Tax=Xyrichtys novacula TaxID=13765 RepID=A0AAV1EQE5_XYRNO|nr:hypothetical protein NFI96_000077 [Xyrichtys novacula]
MLKMFYQSVVASILFYAAVCLGGSIKHKDARRLNKLVKKAGSVVGLWLDSVEDVVERSTPRKVENILINMDHPLHNTLIDQRVNGGGQLLSLRCKTERFRRSFVPTAIRLYNSCVNSRWLLETYYVRQQVIEFPFTDVLLILILRI